MGQAPPEQTVGHRLRVVQAARFFHGTIDIDWSERIDLEVFRHHRSMIRSEVRQGPEEKASAEPRGAELSLDGFDLRLDFSAVRFARRLPSRLHAFKAARRLRRHRPLLCANEPSIPPTSTPSKKQRLTKSGSNERSRVRWATY